MKNRHLNILCSWTNSSRDKLLLFIILTAFIPEPCFSEPKYDEPWPPAFAFEMLKQYRDFLFPQARDLVFHLITLSSALLGLTLTFAGQFIKDASRIVRICLAGCWVCLVLSLATAGIGLFDISSGAVICAKGIATVEAEVTEFIALHGPISLGDAKAEVARLSVRGFFEVGFSGALLVVALTLLMIAGLLSHLRESSESSNASPPK